MHATSKFSPSSRNSLPHGTFRPPPMEIVQGLRNPMVNKFLPTKVWFMKWRGKRGVARRKGPGNGGTQGCSDVLGVKVVVRVRTEG